MEGTWKPQTYSNKLGGNLEKVGQVFAKAAEGLARRNPFRWYEWMPLDELERSIDAECPANTRLRVEYRHGEKITFDNKQEAIQNIKTKQKPPPKQQTVAQLAAFWSIDIYGEKHLKEKAQLLADPGVRKFDQLLKETVYLPPVGQSVVYGIKHEVREDGGAERNHIFLVFRGTEEVLDWVANLDCSVQDNGQFKEHGIAVHAGFWKKLEQCRENICSCLERVSKKESLKKQAWDLVITGHSQGAGLAQLMYTYLQVYKEKTPVFLRDREVRCICFAGPSVIALAKEAHYANTFNETGMRECITHGIDNYIFKGDPVPRMYGWPGLVECLQGLGSKFEKAARALDRMCGGWVAGILEASGLTRLLNAIGLKLAQVSGKVASILAGEMRKAAELLVPAIKTIKAEGSRYEHVCNVVYVPPDDKLKLIKLTKRPLEYLSSYRLCDVAISHHSMTGYLAAVHDGALVEDTSPTFSPPPRASTSEEAWKTWHAKAKGGEFENMITVLESKGPGEIERFERIEGAWLILHEAARHGDKAVFQRLLKLGANTLRLDGEQNTFAEAALAAACQEEAARVDVEWFLQIRNLAQQLEDSGMSLHAIPGEIADRLGRADDAVEELTDEERQALVGGSLALQGFDGFTEKDLVGKSSEVATKLARDPGQQTKRENELKHEFLDMAKFGNYTAIFAILADNTSWANWRGETPKQRWSAAMQMVYNQAEPVHLGRLLSYYSTVDEVLALREELKEVEANEAEADREGGTRQVRAQFQGGVARSGSRICAEGLNKAVVSDFLDKVKEYRDVGVQKAIERAMVCFEQSSHKEIA